MSLSAIITPAILDTVLGRLAGHFLVTTKGDLPTARHAASRLLVAHDVRTVEELHLAADIVSLGFHTLEALSQAADPDLSLNKKLRLRGGAVSLSRERHKAQRKLDQLKRVRLIAQAQPEIAANPEAPTPHASTTPDQPAQGQPTAAQAFGLIEFARETLQAGAKKGGIQAFSLSRQQRRAAEQIAENFRHNKADPQRRELATATNTSSHQTAM
jgi:hypothetical protein